MKSCVIAGRITAKKVMKQKNIALIATLDTKGREALFVKRIIKTNRCNAVVIDTGLLGVPLFHADISREKVAFNGGRLLEEMKANPNREISNKIMGDGTANLLSWLYRHKKINGVIGIGGGQGTAIATSAMKVLPVGFPKLMVSTIASGNTRPYVGTKDITMMYSVVDIAGLNFISRKVLKNASNAICGMVNVTNKKSIFENFSSIFKRNKPLNKKKRIVISMYGTTTPCVMNAAEILEKHGFETIKFHASGAGGEAMEKMITEGKFDGVLDVTIAEVTNNFMKGLHDAGSSRLEAASLKGIPHVIVPGAFEFFVANDEKNNEFDGKQYSHRNQIMHSTKIKLIQITKKEAIKLAKIIVDKLNKATAKTYFIVPKRSTSFYSQQEQAFYSPKLIETFTNAIKLHLNKINNKNIIYEEYDLDINDEKFAEIVAEKLMGLLEISQRTNNVYKQPWQSIINGQ